MDIKQILPMLAQMPPEQRRDFARHFNIRPEALARLEEVAESMGMELEGGRSSGADYEEGGGGGGAGDEEEDDDDELRPTLRMVRRGRAAPPRRAPPAPRGPRARAPRRAARRQPPRARSPPSQVLEAARQKAWAYAGTAVFFAAAPLVLYFIKERRGLSWRALAAALLRLPFSD
jgi:hypothetical protein